MVRCIVVMRKGDKNVMVQTSASPYAACEHVRLQRAQSVSSLAGGRGKILFGVQCSGVYMLFV